MIAFKKINYSSLIIFISQIIIINLSDLSDAKQGLIDLIDDPTTDLSNKGGISQTQGDYISQISFLEKQYTEILGIKYPQVQVSQKCKKSIMDQSSGSTDVIVAKLFKQVTLNIDSTTQSYKIADVIFYQFFPYNNGIVSSPSIDISSLCSENVIIYSPLDFEDDNKMKNKFISVLGQNPKSGVSHLRDYDIFDPNAKIYKDICSTITFNKASENIIIKNSFKNYDITLEQRKKHYFPGNLQFCPQEECSYLGIDIETFSAMCKCEFNKNFNYNSGNTNDINEHTTFSSFNYNANKFKKSSKDNYFSMETIKCIKLPFTKTGFKGNYGSILMIAIICIVAFSYIILAIRGKNHLLTTFELLYNTNIKSMNYIKNNQVNYSQNLNGYDTKSNNYFLNSQKGVQTNGLLMSNILSGSNFLIPSPNYQATPMQVTQRSYNKNNTGTQIVNQNALNKNQQIIEKSNNNLIVDEIKENDSESERNSISKDKTEIISNKEKTDLTNNKANIKSENQQIQNNEPKKEDSESEEDEISNVEQNNNNNVQNKNLDEDNDEEDDDDDEEENKANPPKKKGGKRNSKLLVGNEANNNENENGGKKQVENTGKKKKEKTPIEIALNVKELREMMLQNMPKGQQKPKENGNVNPPLPQNNQNNGFNFPPFMNPLNFMPPMLPNYNFNNNEDAIRKEYENRERQKELEFQRERELADMREKERRRELEDMRERERQRQREQDYQRERMQREDQYNLYRNRDRDRDKERYYENKMKDEELKREKDRLNQQNQEIQQMREKLQKEYNERQNKDKERDLEMQKELTKVKDKQKEKEIEFEKELIKQKEELREKFEKEKKELIEKKDKEIQTFREEKDREIQRLKEDKDRELKYMKEDIEREKKNQEEDIKKKEKEFKKEKQKMKEMQKNITSNSFFMNGINGNTTMQQQMMEMNNNFDQYEKIDIPQIVVPVESIFTDQELNAMDYHYACIYDKRTICQMYLSFINRKQPLFFLFNHNRSSSRNVSLFQINFQSIKFIVFCLEIMIYLFFYATFFGSKSISYIFNDNFNARRKCIIAIIFSPFCMIVKSVIHFFIFDDINNKIAEIKMRCYNNFSFGKKKEEIKVNEFKDFWESEEDKKNDNDKDNNKDKEEIADIQEIEDDNLPEEEKIRRKEKYEKRKLKAQIKELIDFFKMKIIISVIVMIFVLFFMWYYISAFCAVYKNSQLIFFGNILISFLFSNLFPFVYCFIPTIFRHDGIRDESRLGFFISKIFQII